MGDAAPVVTPPNVRTGMRSRRARVRALKVALWAVGLWPIARLVWRGFTGDLGANPVEELLHRTGDAAIIGVLATLAVTPVRRLAGWNLIVQGRRLIGLFAFFYVSLHFFVWLAIDQTLDWEFIVEDIAERPFVTVGFVGWILLIPLAVTSTKGWIRRLGRRWRRLHKLVYVTAVLGAVHFYWNAKADTRWPVVVIAILAALFAARMNMTRGGADGTGKAR